MKLSVWLSFVVLWTAVSTSSQLEQNEARQSKVEQTGISPGEKSGKLFFGSVSTQSHTLVRFTTSTLFFSCLGGLASVVAPGLGAGAPDVTTTASCNGKRRRKRRTKIEFPGHIKGER